MKQRIPVIIASIVVVLGLVIGVWYFFFANSAELSVGTPTDPFGTSGDRDPSLILRADGEPIQGAGTVVAPRLIRITDVPVAKGASVVYIPPVTVSNSASGTASSTLTQTPEDVEIRFIERQSGNIYGFRVKDRTLTRLSNRTIPGIEDATWTRDGLQAFVRYLTRAADGTERIDTYALPASGEEGYFMEQGIEQVLLIGSSSVFTLRSTATGSTGVVANVDGTGARTLFGSPLSRLRAGASAGTIIATTKASTGLDGYSFIVGANGSFTRILGPLRGLSTLPNTEGTYVLYSYVDRGRTYLQALNLSTRTAIPLPLATLTEKCAWEPGGQAIYCGVPTSMNGNLPDDWYQGAHSFSDRIWRIDLGTRLATLIVDPAEVGDVAIDAVSLSIDSASDTLVFTNKRDLSLWVYDL